MAMVKRGGSSLTLSRQSALSGGRKHVGVCATIGSVALKGAEAFTLHDAEPLLRPRCFPFPTRNHAYD